MDETEKMAQQQLEKEPNMDDGQTMVEMAMLERTTMLSQILAKKVESDPSKFTTDPTERIRRELFAPRPSTWDRLLAACKRFFYRESRLMKSELSADDLGAMRQGAALRRTQSAEALE